MAAPKGIRSKSFKLNNTDSVFVYSDIKNLWLQLRRDYPTQQNIEVSSFKSTLRLTPEQAIALAGELLTASSQHKGTQPNVVAKPIDVPENHGKQWDEKEEKQLLQRYQSGISIEDIAKRHKRGVGGVRARLVKLGQLDQFTSE